VRNFLFFGAMISTIAVRACIAGWRNCRRLATISPRRISMMTDPATVIKREVFHLINQQIETLRRDGHLTDTDLDQFRLRSGRISDLYQEHDRIVRSRISPLLRLARAS
jgi:hypothetical protein